MRIEDHCEIGAPLDGRVRDVTYLFRVHDRWKSNVLFDVLAFSME